MSTRESFEYGPSAAKQGLPHSTQSAQVSSHCVRAYPDEEVLAPFNASLSTKWIQLCKRLALVASMTAEQLPADARHSLPTVSCF